MDKNLNFENWKQETGTHGKSENWKRIEIVEMGNKTITILDNFNYCLNQAKQATFYKYIMGGKWEH